MTAAKDGAERRKGERRTGEERRIVVGDDYNHRRECTNDGWFCCSDRKLQRRSFDRNGSDRRVAPNPPAPKCAAPITCVVTVTPERYNELIEAEDALTKIRAYTPESLAEALHAEYMEGFTDRNRIPWENLSERARDFHCKEAALVLQTLGAAPAPIGLDTPHGRLMRLPISSGCVPVCDATPQGKGAEAPYSELLLAYHLAHENPGITVGTIADCPFCKRFLGGKGAESGGSQAIGESAVPQPKCVHGQPKNMCWACWGKPVSAKPASEPTGDAPDDVFGALQELATASAEYMALPHVRHRDHLLESIKRARITHSVRKVAPIPAEPTGDATQVTAEEVRGWLITNMAIPVRITSGAQRDRYAVGVDSQPYSLDEVLVKIMTAFANRALASRTAKEEK